MKRNPLKTGILLSLLLFLMACSSSKKTLSQKEEPQTLPELPLSELDIPIRIAAAPVLGRVEALVPLEFTSDGWPQYMQPSCDFRYKYRFVRSALQVSC